MKEKVLKKAGCLYYRNRSVSMLLGMTNENISKHTCLTICCCLLCALFSSDPLVNGTGVRKGTSN